MGFKDGFELYLKRDFQHAHPKKVIALLSDIERKTRFRFSIQIEKKSTIVAQ